MGPRTDLTRAVVGNYRIESLIDEGGMGRVYRGRHIHLERTAAIKIMLPELEAIPGYQARFLQEARAAAALRHPNVVEIYECGEQAGRYYLAMELVPDGSLLNLMRGQKRSLDQPPFSLALGLELVRQAAVGLDYAHRRGMVHRDVKPGNLLLEAKGQDSADVSREGREAIAEVYTLKVSDFGLARLKEGGVETTVGKVRGTLAYMSPEQCKGIDLDGRSDLYALGIILFELTTGQRPFAVKTPADAIYKHIHEPPPSPRSLRPEIPAELEEVILRCLAKDPKDRYPSCASLASNLQSLVDKGVLAEDASQQERHPEVTASLHSIPLGVIVEPPEILDAPIGNEGGGIGADQDGQSASLESSTLVRSRSSHPIVRLSDREGATLKVIDLTGEGLTVGRLPDNDFALEAVGISRHHLRIDWDGSDASVTDLGSHNGTFRGDGTRLTPEVSHPWQLLESLRIGRYWLRLEMTTRSAAAGEPSASISETALGARTATEVESSGEVEPTLKRIVEEIPKATSARTVTEQGVPSDATELRAAGPIELSLDPVQLCLTPGLTGRVTVALANHGDTPERLGLLVEGVPDDWLTGDGENVLVGPGQQGALALTVLVPPGPSSRAGDYTAVIRATRRAAARGGETGEEQTSPRDASAVATVADECEKLPFTASGRWTVSEVVKHSLVLLPERLRALRVAEYQVKLENDGNSQSTLELSATEPELSAESSEAGEGKANGKAETLIYEFSQPKVSLEPGQTTEVTLKVTAPARLVGPEETRPFEVSVKASEAGQPITAKAELVRRALVPLWAVFAASLVFVLTVVAVLASSPEVRTQILGVNGTSTPSAQLAQSSPLPIVALVPKVVDTPTGVVAPSPTDTPTSPLIAGAEATTAATPTPQATVATSAATPESPTTAEPASPTPTELPEGTPVGSPTQTQNDMPAVPPSPTKTPTSTPRPTPTYTPTPVPCYALTTSVSPAGVGHVTVALPNCASDRPDTPRYRSGTSVTLSATANTGYAFAAWSGGASGTNSTITLKMDGDRQVTASFSQCRMLTRVSSPPAGGSVVLDPQPNCPTDPTKYKDGTPVKLTAKASTGYSFGSWSGDATGSTSTANVTMSANRSVTASFRQVCYTLTLALSVTTLPAYDFLPAASPNKSLACSTASRYVAGEKITIGPTRISWCDNESCFYFQSWTGATADPTDRYRATLTMPSADHKVLANYSEVPRS